MATSKVDTLQDNSFRYKPVKLIHIEFLIVCQQPEGHVKMQTGLVPASYVAVHILITTKIQVQR